MVLDFGPLAERIDQVAVLLDQIADFSIRWVLPVSAVALLFIIYLFGRDAQKTADRLGITRESLIGALLILKKSGDLTPEEVLSRVREDRGDDE